MVVILNTEHIRFLYTRAKEKYLECISNPDNESLQLEVGVPLNSFALREATVKIVFSQEDTDDYLLETSLNLFSENKIIGRYSHVENSKGESIDDSLVFY